ncbi:MAG: hypothetical protein SFV51_27940 [Bryobacteraceae bacterium]|nr:hypothetical protein [Bryobacteraceae bacterium]
MRFLFTAALAAVLPAMAATVSLLTTSGAAVEGETSRKKITVETEQGRREIPLSRVLSIHSGEPASEHERARIEAGLIAVAGSDRARRDLAVEELTAIGIPVLTPLLKTYKDTDAREPNPLYRLFPRIMPSHSDQIGRNLSLVRLAGGETVRGKLDEQAWVVNGQSVPAASMRRVAVRQKIVKRVAEVHSLHHSNQIEYFDTGIILTAGSQVESTARGFVRLSWDTDDWATGADGLKKPAANYKTNLVNGHPFGALVGRLTAAGEMFFMGSRFRKAGAGPGRLYLSINDNRHWQNNLGSYRVTLSATEAYDAGDGQ